jgi:GT2 family glycosyltransferase
MTTVDVSVVAYGSRDRIAALLPRLHTDDDVGKVVVVDHGVDGSAAVARDEGAIVVGDPSNPGFGAGHNSGVARTDGPFVLLINPDLVPETGVLAEATDFMEQHPTAGAVQGVILSESDGAPERSAGRALGPIHLWGRLLHLRSLLRLSVVRAVVRRSPQLADHVDRTSNFPREVESLAATMILLRRKAFDEIGGFDSSYFLYGEDLDLCARLRDAGWSLWSLPSIWATHASGESSGTTWDRELVWWEGTMRFASLWWSTGAWLGGLVAAVLRAGSLAVRRPSRAVEVMRRLVAAPVRARRLR